MQTLDLNIKDCIGINFDTLASLHPRGKINLVRMLDLRQTRIQISVSSISKLRKLIKIGHPAIRSGHLVKEGRQARVALLEPTTWSHAIGLVIKALGPNRVPLFERLTLDNFSVQCGHAVDRVRGVAGNPRHTDSVARDGSHVVDGCAINAALGHVQAETTIDLANDFRNTGEETIEDVDIPGLQSLSQDRVVRVRESMGDNFPCFFPAEAVLIHEDAHEFRDSQNRVRVIELNGIELRKAAQIIAVFCDVVINDCLQRSRAEEVLLAHAQNLTFEGRIVGVQHTGNIHGAFTINDRVGEALRVEGIVVEVLHGLSLPQAQRIDVLRAVAGNRHVIRNSADSQIRVANNALFFLAANDEGVTLFHPRVGMLSLEAVIEKLLEQTVTVQNTVASNRQIQGCARIQEARSQSTKATVTQCCIGLFFQDHGQVFTQCRQGLAGLVDHSKVGKII